MGGNVNDYIVDVALRNKALVKADRALVDFNKALSGVVRRRIGSKEIRSLTKPPASSSYAPTVAPLRSKTARAASSPGYL